MRVISNVVRPQSIKEISGDSLHEKAMVFHGVSQGFCMPGDACGFGLFPVKFLAPLHVEEVEIPLKILLEDTIMKKKNNESLVDVVLVAAAAGAAAAAAILAADKALKSEKGQETVATVKTKAAVAKENVKAKATAAKETIKVKAGEVKANVQTKAAEVKDKVRSKFAKESAEASADEMSEETVQEAAADEPVADAAVESAD